MELGYESSILQTSVIIRFRIPNDSDNQAKEATKYGNIGSSKAFKIREELLRLVLW